MTSDAGNHCPFDSCNRPATFPVGLHGWICEFHAGTIWERIELRDAVRDTQVTGMEWRDYVRSDARAKRSVERRKPSSVGQIYFVQVHDLIKVGWTTKLADRVRSYGPAAELLANYPGTRADEGALHRQLTPSRHRGREWYSDTDIIRAFIAEAVRKHGPPRFDRISWTEPKASNIKPKPRR